MSACAPSGGPMFEVRQQQNPAALLQSRCRVAAWKQSLDAAVRIPAARVRDLMGPAGFRTETGVGPHAAVRPAARAQASATPLLEVSGEAAEGIRTHDLLHAHRTSWVLGNQICLQTGGF